MHEVWEDMAGKKLYTDKQKKKASNWDWKLWRYHNSSYKDFIFIFKEKISWVIFEDQ